jgi:hypothetical protein
MMAPLIERNASRIRFAYYLSITFILVQYQGQRSTAMIPPFFEQRLRASAMQTDGRDVL